MNRHEETETDGFEGVRGRYGFGRQHVEGENLLKFADAMDLVVANTWFQKSSGKPVTYVSGGCKTVVYYILFCKNERSQLRNITVMQGELCLQQHKLLVCMMELKECV